MGQPKGSGDEGVRGLRWVRLTISRVRSIPEGAGRFSTGENFSMGWRWQGGGRRIMIDLFGNLNT